MDFAKNFVGFIAAICFIVIVGGAGYYFGFKSNNVDNKDNDDLTYSLKFTDEDVEKLGKNLYDQTLVGYGYDYYFYGNGKVTVDTIEVSEQLYATLDNISFSSIEYANSVQLNELYSDSCISNNVEGKYTCYIYRVKKDDFAQKYLELFNKSMPNFTDFIYFDDTDFRECRLENDYINCYPMEGGDRLGPLRRFLNYNRTEFKNNSIIVYADFIGFNIVGNASYYYAYSDYELTSKIDNTNYSSELNNYMDNKDSMFTDKDKLFERFKGKTGQFKLTFKQNELDNWYWVSTEIVK